MEDFRTRSINREQRITRNKSRLLHGVSMKTIGVFAIYVFPLVLSASMFIFTQTNLFKVSREDYNNIKNISEIEREIDVMKLNLLSVRNVISIQNESKELGFVYEGNVKHLK